jgi:phosphopantothenoylcysteine decarboxylase / phosphopantothenate---cysteine ligase
MLKNKHILLGVCGGIAAYKIPLLVRLLVKEGAKVKVVMSKDAQQFVTAQTLSVLSKNEVTLDFFDANHNWNNHVHLAEWADVMLIAPLTANTLGKMANGLCDNVLLATYLSAKCTVMVAPAMDLDMYRHPSTIANLDTLKSYGHLIIPAESGELASGLQGEGRMAEPETLFRHLQAFFDKPLALSGKKVLINAGPTYEAIDPVRFIGNRSSGKMGIALADCFAELGAEVTLVLGPTHLRPQNKSIDLVLVESASDMLNACLKVFKECDIAVCAAAVADYRAAELSETKIKKKQDDLDLKLIKTQDILKTLGELKSNKQCLVGFALETEDVEVYAKQKLREKKADIIIANSARNAYGVVFGSDSNQITIIDSNNKITKFELLTKEMAAREIINYVMSFTGISA